MPTLRVYPNPWKAKDRHGRLCAVVPKDPEGDGGAPGQYVGARVDRKATQVLQDFGENAKHELRSPLQSTAYEYLGIQSTDPELARKLFACTPVELPRTRYYRERIRHGALFPADAQTAEQCKVKFVPVAQLLKRLAPADASPAAPPAPSMPSPRRKSAKAAAPKAETAEPTPVTASAPPAPTETPTPDPERA